MIEHIVLFRFKDSTTPGQIVEARDALLAMKKGIPEIQAVHFGPNLGPSVKEYSHVLVVSCPDMGAGAAVSRPSGAPADDRTLRGAFSRCEVGGGR
jgi:hypothetical protein